MIRNLDPDFGGYPFTEWSDLTDGERWEYLVIKAPMLRSLERTNPVIYRAITNDQTLIAVSKDTDRAHAQIEFEAGINRLAKHLLAEEKARHEAAKNPVMAAPQHTAVPRERVAAVVHQMEMGELKPRIEVMNQKINAWTQLRHGPGGLMPADRTSMFTAMSVSDAELIERMSSGPERWQVMVVDV